MDSRSTRRPITFEPLSICSIESAGTMRRRRASQPERTESASGVSGEVPYIGHSTVPTTRPRASATRKPAVRRRSMARALMLPNLFLVYEETPPLAVKLLLERRRLGLGAPLARHREPCDAEQDELEPAQDSGDPPGHGLARPPPPERRPDRAEQEQQARLGCDEPDADPGGVVVDVVFLREDHLGEDPGDDPRRHRDGDERPEGDVAQDRDVWAPPGGEGRDRRRQHRPEEQHGAEDVQEERQERAAERDHWPGFQIMSIRRSSAARPASQDIAF